MVFHTLTFARSRGRCWKPRPKAVVFNTSQGTWRMLMHWKTMFDRYYCIKTENICYISRYFLHYFVSPFHRCCAYAISMLVLDPQSKFWAEIWNISEFFSLKNFSFWWKKFQYIWIGVFLQWPNYLERQVWGNSIDPSLLSSKGEPEEWESEIVRNDREMSPYLVFL